MTAAGEETLGAADAAARQAAQTVFSRPIVLEAGAGTGKTSALVARIVAWCAGEGWVRARSALQAAGATPSPEAIAVRTLSRVVAITFTEAAASEMNERVGLALVALERGECPQGVLRHALPEDEEAWRRRAAALLSALDHLVVRTIHAFCRRLLSRHPLESGLHPGFDVDADGARLDEIVRLVVLEHTRDALSEPVDPDFRRLFALGYQPQDIFGALRYLASEAVSPDLLAHDPLSGRRVEELAGRVRRACQGLRAVVGDRLAGASRSQKSLDLLDAAGHLEARIVGFDAAAEGGLLSRLLQWAAELLDDGMISRLDEWRRGKLNLTEDARLSEVRGPLSEAAGALAALLRHLQRIDPERLDLARRVMHPMLGEVHRRMRSAGAESFSALLVDARELLARRPRIRGLIQQGIDQLLVDEFQDTDALQCDVIRWLALEGDSRPGLFIVGDPKQSIYGWRDADLRAYDAFVQEVLAAGGERHILSLNFRSVPAILDEVRAVVAPIMRERLGLQPRFQPLIPSRADEPGFGALERGAVEYWNSWLWEGTVPQPETRAEEATELEAAALAAELRRLHDEAGVSWGAVGLLLRSSGDLDRYLRALRDAGIPYTVERDRSYYRRREIIDAAALVRALVDPHDHIALIGFLRSATCGVPDAALLPLWSQSFPRLMTELTRPDSPEMAQLEELLRTVAASLLERADQIPGLARIEGWEESAILAINDLARGRAELLRLPSDVFVEHLRARVMLEVLESARYQGVYRLANLDRFFRRLQEALEEGGDIEGVLRALRRSVAEVADDEEGRPKEAAEDAVSVMTIHKAKGLDFDHVYVLQLHRTGDESRPPVHAIERRGQRRGQEYVLFGAPTLGWDEVDRYQREVAAAERVRLLYVAMTRARERLVLAGRWRADTAPIDPTDARCLMDLVSGRASGLPRPEDLARAARDADADRVQQDGICWVFPGRAGAAVVPPTAQADEQDAPSIEAVRALSQGLAEARLQARQAAARLRGGEAWATPEARSLEELAWTVPASSGTATTALMAVGTAIHHALTQLDLEASDLDAELARSRAAVVDVLRPLLRAEQVGPAIRTTERLLGVIFRAGVPAQLQALRPHILARALPILLPPDPTDPDGPIGFLSGSIDLIYTDPDDGELVVADFKTDDVASMVGMDERARAYGTQGARYCAAVQAALGSAAPPRWEVWFVRTNTRLRMDAVQVSSGA